MSKVNIGTTPQSLQIGKPVAFTGVLVRAGYDASGNEVTYSAGDSAGYVLEVETPDGTQQTANDILSGLRLRNFVFQPMIVGKARINPVLAIGDAIVSGDVATIAHHIGSSHTAGMFMDAEAPHDMEVSHEYQYQPKAERQVNRLNSSMAKANARLDVNESDIQAKVSKEDGNSSFGWSLTDSAWSVLSNGVVVLSVDSSGLSVVGSITARGSVSNYVGSTLINRFSNAGLYIRSDPSVQYPYWYKIQPYDLDGFSITYQNEQGYGKASLMTNAGICLKESANTSLGAVDWASEPYSAILTNRAIGFRGASGSPFYNNTRLAFDSLYVDGTIACSGTKSRAAHTDDYGDRLLYCYETPSPMFGDIGEGEIGEDGYCYIWLDPILSETISDGQYQVFLQKYGVGECYVSERKSSVFVVSGTPGLSFGWELKAKQAGYEQFRLERKEPQVSVATIDYADEAANYISNLFERRKDA